MANDHIHKTIQLTNLQFDRKRRWDKVRDLVRQGPVGDHNTIQTTLIVLDRVVNIDREIERLSKS